MTTPPVDLRHDHGPFDLLGDVHGCLDEVLALLTALGYHIASTDHPQHPWTVSHPDGHRVVFLGDLVDRGPDTPGVLRLAMAMSAEGSALCIKGNHDDRLVRKLRGRAVQITHGLGASLEQLAREPADFVLGVVAFLDGLAGHYVLDDGKLVVAHAGLKASLHGMDTPAARSFALYGQPTGATDPNGLPLRHPWANDYRGTAAVVYGHTPVATPHWVHNTLCIDTGCVFGGRLTALRWPTREIVSVPAARVYCTPVRAAATPQP